MLQICYYSCPICLSCTDGMWNSLQTQTAFFFFLSRCLSGLPTPQRRDKPGVCQSTHRRPQPTTWQRTSPPRSSSRRKATGHAASGWGLRLYPSEGSAGEWAPHQTWWARQQGSGTSTGEWEQRSRLPVGGKKKKKEEYNKSTKAIETNYRTGT